MEPFDPNNFADVQKIISSSGEKGAAAAQDDSLVRKVMNWAIQQVSASFTEGDTDTLTRAVAEKIINGAKTGTDGLLKMMNNAFNSYVGDPKKIARALGFEGLESKIGDTMGAIQGVLKETGFIPIEFTTEGIDNQVKKIGSMIGEEGVGEVAISFGVEQLAAQVRQIRQSVIAPFTKDLDALSKAGGELFSRTYNPFGAQSEMNTAATKTLQETQRTFAQQTINLRMRFGISTEEAKRDVDEVYKNLSNYTRQIDTSGFKIGEVEGAEAVVVAARAVGESVSEMTQDIDKMTATFGLTGSQAAERISTIGKASSASGLSFKAFKDMVMATAGEFSSFGDVTEEASALLERFTKNASRERLGAVTAAFAGVTKNISVMSDEMKAFVGMGTELAGGGGAIESIVRLDAALQSGDKDALQGIFEESMARIEELTGAPVMTMQEAVESGQESTYYQQARLAKQFGFAQNSAQASDVFAAYRTGTVDIEEIKRRDDVDLASVAAKKAAGQMPAGEIAANLLEASALQMKFNALWKDNTTSFMAKTGEMGESLLSTSRAFTGVASIFDAFANKHKAITEAKMKKVEEGDLGEASSTSVEAYTGMAQSERVTEVSRATEQAAAERGTAVAVTTAASATERSKSAADLTTGASREREAVVVPAASAGSAKTIVNAAASAPATTAPAAGEGPKPGQTTPLSEVLAANQAQQAAQQKLNVDVRLTLDKNLEQLVRAEVNTSSGAPAAQK